MLLLCHQVNSLQNSLQNLVYTEYNRFYCAAPKLNIYSTIQIKLHSYSKNFPTLLQIQVLHVIIQMKLTLKLTYTNIYGKKKKIEVQAPIVSSSDYTGSCYGPSLKSNIYGTFFFSRHYLVVVDMGSTGTFQLHFRTRHNQTEMFSITLVSKYVRKKIFG